MSKVPADAIKERLKRRRDNFLNAKIALQKAASKMCKGGKVKIVVCNAGEGAAGQELKSQLTEIFGGLDVEVFAGNVCFRSGEASPIK